MAIAVSKRPFSYTDQKTRRRNFFFLFKVFVLLFIAYTFVTWLFLSTYRAASRTMEPGISSGDFILMSPLAYGPVNPFGKGFIPGLGNPGYGDTVLVNPPWIRENPVSGFLESIARFATFQFLDGRKDGSDWEHSPVIKRVIALPGDKLYMKDFVFYVKSAGSEFYLSEFELSISGYEIGRSSLPDGYADWMPVSGASSVITLAEGEYFVAGDDRTVSGDSRNWGPVTRSSILAKSLLVYWPISRFRRL